MRRSPLRFLFFATIPAWPRETHWMTDDAGSGPGVAGGEMLGHVSRNVASRAGEGAPLEMRGRAIRDAR